MTGNDLIAAALRRIGSLGQGETPNASESADAQLVWNSMLDSWSTDRGNLYTWAEFTQNLVNTQQTYQMGSGAGDFNTPRPVHIQAAAVTYSGYRWPLDLIGADQWSATVQRSAGNTLPYQLFQDYGIGGSKLDGARWAALLATSPLLVLPWQMYCDYGSPIAKLNFFPVPSAAGISFNAILWSVLSQITDLTKDLTTYYNLPPGYVEAMRLNLAFKLCEEWGTQMPQGLAMEAQQSLAAMRQLNAQNALMIDAEGTAGAAPRPMVQPAPPQPPAGQ